MNFNDQKGVVSVVPLLLIISLVGVVTFLLLASIGPFKGGFDNLFSKDASQAATQAFYYQYAIGGSALPLDYQVYSGGVVATNGQKMAVVDRQHNRVLIYNTIPTSDSALPNVVIGQVDFSHVAANQGGSVGPNTLKLTGVYSNAGVLFVGNKLIIADGDNNRILIYNSIPTTNNASADVVIGQADFTHNSSNFSQNTLSGPGSLASDGTKLIVSDYANSRVLIFNSIPTTNNASANVVIGQPDFTHNSWNQGGPVGPNTLNYQGNIVLAGGKLAIADNRNNRVLVYNSIPTTNNASANVVIGQPDFTHNTINQGLNSPTAYTLNSPYSIATDGIGLFLGDGNSRLQIYNNVPTTNNAPADDSLSGYWFNQPLYHYNGLLYASPPNSSVGMGVYGATNPSPTATSTSSPTQPPTCPLGPLGDIDCDGDIDIFDFNILVTNFGR